MRSLGVYIVVVALRNARLEDGLRGEFGSSQDWRGGLHDRESLWSLWLASVELGFVQREAVWTACVSSLGVTRAGGMVYIKVWESIWLVWLAEIELRFV